MLVCLQCFAEDAQSDAGSVDFVQGLNEWIKFEASGQDSNDRPLLALLLDGARSASQMKKFLISNEAGVVNGDKFDSLLQVGIGWVESGGASIDSIGTLLAKRPQMLKFGPDPLAEFLRNERPSEKRDKEGERE